MVNMYLHVLRPTSHLFIYCFTNGQDADWE